MCHANIKREQVAVIYPLIIGVRTWKLEEEKKEEKEERERERERRFEKEEMKGI